MPKLFSQLHYARSTVPPRRKLLGWGLVGITAMVLAVSAVRYGVPWVKHQAYIHAQRQCLEYAAPAEQVVFEQGPDVAGRSLPARFYPVAYWWSDQRPTASAGRPVGFMPAPWDWIGGKRPGVAFMHAMRTENGVERLVVIAFSSMGDRDKGTYGAVAT